MVHSAMEVTHNDRELELCLKAKHQHEAVLNIRRELLKQQPSLLGYRTMWHRSECMNALSDVVPLLKGAGVSKEDFMKLLVLAEDRAELKVHIDNLLGVVLSLVHAPGERQHH